MRPVQSFDRNGTTQGQMWTEFKDLDMAQLAPVELRMNVMHVAVALEDIQVEKVCFREAADGRKFDLKSGNATQDARDLSARVCDRDSKRPRGQHCYMGLRQFLSWNELTKRIKR